jgi:hypothetical protein
MTRQEMGLGKTGYTIGMCGDKAETSRPSRRTDTINKGERLGQFLKKMDLGRDPRNGEDHPVYIGHQTTCYPTERY